MDPFVLISFGVYFFFGFLWMIWYARTGLPAFYPKRVISEVVMILIVSLVFWPIPLTSHLLRERRLRRRSS